MCFKFSSSFYIARPSPPGGLHFSATEVGWTRAGDVLHTKPHPPSFHDQIDIFFGGIPSESARNFETPKTRKPETIESRKNLGLELSHLVYLMPLLVQLMRWAPRLGFAKLCPGFFLKPSTPQRRREAAFFQPQDPPHRPRYRLGDLPRDNGASARSLFFQPAAFSAAGGWTSPGTYETARGCQPFGRFRYEAVAVGAKRFQSFGTGRL